MPHSNQSIYKVQALERALDILDCFSLHDRELSLSEVVSRTGLNKTTAKRLTANLTAREYLQQDPQTKRYQLGMRLFELGGGLYSSFALRWAAAYPMTRLQRETGGTILLGVRFENQLVYIDKREGKGALRISSDIGWRRPLHYGMLGMVLMAGLDPKDASRVLREEPLQSHTPFSVTADKAFALRLKHVRRQGYVVEKREAVAEAVGIGAPIRDYSSQVVAALGVALPFSSRRIAKNIDRTVRLVKTTCEAVSADLGYMKI